MDSHLVVILLADLVAIAIPVFWIVYNGGKMEQRVSNLEQNQRLVNLEENVKDLKQDHRNLDEKVDDIADQVSRIVAIQYAVHPQEAKALDQK